MLQLLGSRVGWGCASVKEQVGDFLTGLQVTSSFSAATDFLRWAPRCLGPWTRHRNSPTAWIQKPKRLLQSSTLWDLNCCSLPATSLDIASFWCWTLQQSAFSPAPHYLILVVTASVTLLLSHLSFWDLVNNKVSAWGPLVCSLCASASQIQTRNGLGAPLQPFSGSQDQCVKAKKGWVLNLHSLKGNFI